jgi:hypothetical protein
MLLNIHFCDTAATMVTWRTHLQTNGEQILYESTAAETGDIERLIVSGGISAGVDSTRHYESVSGKWLVISKA